MTYRYFAHALACPAGLSLVGRMKRWKTVMHELSAEARLHLRARVVSNDMARRLHAFAAYSALALIAAIVIGAISVHPV
jgi:hypothetical protein